MSNIVFMGSPAFAVASLDKLRKVGHLISAVVTVPDKPAGRKRKLSQSEVKQYAQEHNLKLLQPESLKENDFIETIKLLKPDFIVVVAFRKLPSILFEIPKYATFNLHASLLPQYRGAAPINHAIINGETKTGLTTFILDNKIDTGDIILQKEVEIDYKETFGMLYNRLKVLGAEACVETIELISSGKDKIIPQKKLFTEETSLKKAPKIFKHDCEINWNDSSENIYNLIRGLSPVPCAFTHVETQNGKIMLKVFMAYTKKTETNEVCGIVKTDNKDFLGFTTQDGIVYLTEVQAAGKKPMKITDFLRGNKVLL